MPLTTLIDHFLAWCREHRTLATAEFYRHGLRRLRELHADRSLADLTPIEVEAWLTAAGRKSDGSPAA